MREKKALSIIIAAYNVEKYIEKCIESTLNQNSEDYEVIVINDGSTDKTEEIIKKISEKEPKIKYIKQINSGLSEVRNNGLKVAKGEFVFFIDGDDFIEKDVLSELIEKVNTEKSDILIFGFNRVLESGKIVGKKNFENISFEEILSNSYACNKVFRKEFFRKTGIKFPANRHYEDLFVIPKLFFKAKKIICYDKYIYNYLLRDGAITQLRDNKRKKDVLHAAIEIKETLIKEKKYEEYKGDFNRFTKLLKKGFLGSLDNSSFKFKMSNISETKKLLKELKIFRKQDNIRLLFCLIYPKYYIRTKPIKIIRGIQYKIIKENS